MKKFLFVIALALLTPCAFSQNVTDELARLLAEQMPEVFDQYISGLNKNRFENRKKKGYFNTTQIGILRGNTQIIQSIIYQYYPTQSYIYDTRTEMQLSPSFTMTNGYMINEHWAAGVGVGFEIFDRNLFPVFADIRYTLWDNKISPFFTVKAGYSFGDYKKRQCMIWNPYSPIIAPNAGPNADFLDYGGFMLHPEMGVKVILSESADLLFTIAYRYQKTKTTITQTIDPKIPHYNEWDFKEKLNLLSFGIAIMFR